MIRGFVCFSLAALVVLSAQQATAQLVSFVEDFENGTANFGVSDDRSIGDLGGDVTTGPGGVNGSQQLLTTTTLDDINAFQGVLFRNEAVLGSSGGAFVGNYVADGVEEVSVVVQHDAPIDLSFGFRFASPMNFPGGFALGFDGVVRNTPTELAVEISSDNLFNPAMGRFSGLAFFEQPTTAPLDAFNIVFGNVGNIQVTVGLPSGLAAVSQELINTAAADDDITLPDGLGLGDIVDDFTILEDVPIFDENGQPVIVQGMQVVRDLALPNPGAVAVFNTGDDITFGLDNVTITAVPEPAAIALFAVAGFVGVLGRRRGR